MASCADVVDERMHSRMQWNLMELYGCLTVGAAAVLIPFWTSVLVRTYAWLVLLQNKGIVNNALIDLGVIAERLHQLSKR